VTAFAAAIRLGFVNHPSLTEHAPFLAALREQPEYGQLMADVRPRWRGSVSGPAP
jgi:hypothetical protein